MQSRLKSKVVWASVLAQVLIIVGLFLPQISDTVKIVGASVLEILTVFGILNNPTDSTSF
jgi:uncharacterized membrane protein